MTKHKIVLVPFPFDNFSATKVRPAICLTQPIGKHEHVVIAFISSKIPEDILETDLVLHSHSSNFLESGLAVSSVIRLHKLVTIPKNLIKRQMGQLNNTLHSKLNQKIDLLFKH